MATDKIAPVLEGASGVLSKTADYLAQLTAALSAGENAPRDVNDNPLGVDLGNIGATATGALADLKRAAALKRLIPWAIFGVGVLIRRPVVGAVVALAVYAAGEMKSAAPAK